MYERKGAVLVDRGKVGYKMWQGRGKAEKIPSPEEKRWLTETVFIRYNTGRIFWREGFSLLLPPSGQGG